jgi:hypothetical protein
MAAETPSRLMTRPDRVRSGELHRNAAVLATAPGYVIANLWGWRTLVMFGVPRLPPEGLELAAIHWQRGHKGDVRCRKIESQEHRLARYKTTIADIVTEARDYLDTEHRAELRDHLGAMIRDLDNEEMLDAEIKAEEAELTEAAD